jgi:hypothetical protein
MPRNYVRDDDDDDDAFDERGILKDGRIFRLRFADANSLQRAVAAHFAKVTDSNGRGGAALQRPGYRVLDDAAGLDEKQKAYLTYDENIRRAYLDVQSDDPITGFGSGELRGSQENDICTVRNADFPLDFGSPGHMRMYNGKLTCVPDRPRSKAANDTRDHATVMAEEYSRYEQSLRDAWRTAP